MLRAEGPWAIRAGALLFSPLAASAAEEGALRPETFGQVVLHAAGLCGWLTVALSLAGFSVAFYLWLRLRADQWVPAGVAAELKALLAQGRVDDARRLCEMDGSFLSEMALVGLGRRGAPPAAVEKAVQAAAEARLSPWYQRVGWVGLVAAIAPMLGLLGTVIGMIETFGTIKAVEGGVEPKDLAGGVEYALVTTYIGLMVAIPHLLFHHHLRGKLDALVRRAGAALEEAFRPGAAA